MTVVYPRCNLSRTVYILINILRSFFFYKRARFSGGKKTVHIVISMHRYLKIIHMIQHQVEILKQENLYSIIDLELQYTPLPRRGILQGYIFLKAYTKCYKMSHVSTLAVGAFRIFGVKREEIMQKSLKIGNNFSFFLKADIEDQYMTLDSTFDAISNGTNYKFQFHR